MKLPKILIVAATIMSPFLCAAPPDAPVEFVGWMTAKAETLFVIRDVPGDVNSSWLSIGQSFHGYTVERFDPKAQVLTIAAGAQKFELKLDDAKIRKAAAPETGTAVSGPKPLAALTQILVYQRMVEKFHQDVGRYPTSDEGLAVLFKAPAQAAPGWKGPYLKYDAPFDPWGHPYHYRFPALKSSVAFDIWSLGPDGIESDDDVGNWDHY